MPLKTDDAPYVLSFEVKPTKGYAPTRSEQAEEEDNTESVGAEIKALPASDD